MQVGICKMTPCLRTEWPQAHFIVLDAPYCRATFLQGCPNPAGLTSAAAALAAQCMCTHGLPHHMDLHVMPSRAVRALLWACRQLLLHSQVGTALLVVCSMRHSNALLLHVPLSFGIHGYVRTCTCCMCGCCQSGCVC